MNRTTQQVELYGAILALIERKREESGDETLGQAVEKVILNDQFGALESEILENPGAIEPWLIRRRRID